MHVGKTTSLGSSRRYIASTFTDVIVNNWRAGAAQLSRFNADFSLSYIYFGRWTPPYRNVYALLLCENVKFFLPSRCSFLVEKRLRRTEGWERPSNTRGTPGLVFRERAV